MRARQFQEGGLTLATSDSAATGKRVATRAAILNATSELIAEKGLDGFTISEIARHGRVNRALIYHYFHDRENLIVETIGHVLDQYERVELSGDGKWIEGNVRMYIEHPELARVIYHMLLEGDRLPVLWKRLQSGIDSLKALRDERGASVDPEFSTIILAMPQLTWAFARHEFARLLGISVEEADERFIATLHTAAVTAFTTMSEQSHETAAPSGTSTP